MYPIEASSTLWWSYYRHHSQCNKWINNGYGDMGTGSSRQLERPVHRHTGDLAGPEASVSPLLSWELVTVHFWPATFTVLIESPACPHCGGDDETAQHLLLCCPSHAQARSSTNFIDSTDPRCMWSFLESIGAVTRPPTGNERERESSRQRNV